MFRLFPFCMLLLFSKVLRGSLLENGASVQGGDGITVAGGVLRIEGCGLVGTMRMGLWLD